MMPCIPQPPRPWLQFPLSLMQMTTAQDPQSYHSHHPPDESRQILLSLRRLLRLLWGSSPIYPLCNTTRQKLTLISHWIPPGHHPLTLHLPFASPLSGSRRPYLLPWNIFTLQQPHTHTLLHKISLFQILGLSWSPVNMMSRNRTLITHTNQILRPVTFYEHFLTSGQGGALSNIVVPKADCGGG
ncbi:hypothetical protein BGY98DRAFT_992498 [Russula aff. rugulosa BPL654]|nr:hypothetical protein BGY98DRAFT_992498 [Russula aff. rugulosa BPL654]